MKNSWVRLLVAVIATATLSVPFASAQTVEISPYGGGVWPGSSNVGELKTNAIWGVRTGLLWDPSFALEGNVGYLNHFEVKGTDPKSRGFLWEVAPTYVFTSADWSVPNSLSPFISLGLGGITTRLKDPNRSTYNIFETTNFLSGPSQTSIRTIELDNGDTFFTVSAGGGMKVSRGPVGFRTDLRARLIPNYYKSSPIWFEATVGLVFTFGRPAANP